MLIFKAHALSAAAASVLLLAAAPAFSAPLTNGGFEDKTVDPWAVNATPFYVGNSYIDPTDPFAPSPIFSTGAKVGLYYAYVQTGLTAGPDTNLYAVPTTLSQTFTLNAGDKISGYLGFTVQAVDTSKFALGLDLTGSGAKPSSLFSAGPDGYSYLLNGAPVDGGAIALGTTVDWQEFDYTATVGDTYTLTLSIFDASSTTGFSLTTSSGAGLDGVTVTPAPSAAPEPASWALMISGVFCVGGALRRRQRQGIALA